MATRTSPAAYEDHESLGRQPRQRRSALDTLTTMALAFLVAALLGSGSLVGLAERQDLGTTRDVSLWAANGVDRFANFFSLNRPADAINELTGRTEEEIDLVELVQPTPLPMSEPTPVPADRLRSVSASAPLRLYVGGDSMTRELGEGMARVTPIDLVDPILDSRVSSGLSRPDFIDWPQELAQIVTDNPPDAMVVMFGANDYQSVEHEGQVLQAGSVEWLALYRTRVGLAMDIMKIDGMTVTWVGQPVMRPGVFPVGAMESLNEIFRNEAAARWWVDYIDIASLFSDGNGTYAQFIDGIDMRQGDGIHLTIPGSDRMATAVWRSVADRWSIPPG